MILKGLFHYETAFFDFGFRISDFGFRNFDGLFIPPSALRLPPSSRRAIRFRVGEKDIYSVLNVLPPFYFYFKKKR